MKRVVAYVPDLMDRSRVSGAAGNRVEFVRDPGDLASVATAQDLVVVDLSRPGVIEVLPGIGATTIGFASHVDRATIDAARAAGCDQVLARSEFFRRIGELLGT